MNKKIQLIAITTLSISSLLAFSYEYKIDEGYYSQNKSPELGYFSIDNDTTSKVIKVKNSPFEEVAVDELYTYPNGCLGDGNKDINTSEY